MCIYFIDAETSLTYVFRRSEENVQIVEDYAKPKIFRETGASDANTVNTSV